MLNLVRNGEMEFWGAGPVPSFMAAQVTNTALSILDISDADDAAPRFAFGELPSRGERYVGEGARSLRATIAAAGAADAFRLNPLNVNALTFLGATAPAVVLTPGKPYVFSFQVKCSVPANLITVRLVARDAAGVVRLYLNTDRGDWTVAANDVDYRPGIFWRTIGQEFVAPATDDAGNLIDSVIWQISNGTGGAQIIDLDDLRMHRADDFFAE